MFGTVYITYNLGQQNQELQDEIDLLRQYIADADYDKRYNNNNDNNEKKD